MTNENENTEAEAPEPTTDFQAVLSTFRDQCNTLLPLVQDAVQAAFGEQQVTLVVGVQTKEVADANEANADFPSCALLSNMPICAVVPAVEDMLYEAERMHDLAHGGDGRIPNRLDPQAIVNEAAAEEGFMVTDPADIPEEVRSLAQTLADQFGVGLDAIEFRTKVHTNDLTEDALPEWLRGSDVAEAMTGGDIADPALGEEPVVKEDPEWIGEVGQNTADAEQAHESGSEQEG